MDLRPAYIDGTYRNMFEILASKHSNPFGVGCVVKAHLPCLCGQPSKGSPTRVNRAWSKLKAVEQIGVEIVHAVTRMRLLDNALCEDYRKLLQRAFPTLSTDRLVSRPSDTEKSEMRTYGMVKRLADMRKSFLDSHSKGLDQMRQQVWEGEAFARRKEYLQLFDILQRACSNLVS
jgi:hypothetical protein